jgi:hypothetical protein
MFTLTEAEVAAIQAAYHAGGELAATAELRRLFPMFADRADATSFAVGIAGWTPIEAPMPTTARPKRKRSE